MRLKNWIVTPLLFLACSANGQTYNHDSAKPISPYDSLLVPEESYELHQFFMDSIHVTSNFYYSDSAGAPVLFDTSGNWRLTWVYYQHFWGHNNESAARWNEEFLKNKNPEQLFAGGQILHAFSQDSLSTVDSLMYSPFNLNEINASTWYFVKAWDYLVVQVYIDHGVEPIYYDTKSYWYYFKKE